MFAVISCYPTGDVIHPWPDNADKVCTCPAERKHLRTLFSNVGVWLDKVRPGNLLEDLP